MRTVLRWFVLTLVMVAAVSAAAGAYQLAGRAWDGVVNYNSPFARVELPASSIGPASVDRVVLVIIDGLRMDASRRMSSLEALRGYGADLTLLAPQPSLSYPNWTTILTGADPDVHGVVTNWHEGQVPVETILDTAKAAGVPYIVVGPSDLATLYPAAVLGQGSFFLDWSSQYLGDRYVDEALRLIAAKNPRLVVLHLPDVDEAGHAAGGASASYAQTVARVDADVRRLVEKLQDTHTAFVVVADHGHIDTGGHGGWEPEVVSVPGVMSGAGIRPLVGEYHLSDIAPTVAVLVGIPVPRYATGEVLQSALASPTTDALQAASRHRLLAIEAFAGVVSGSTGETDSPLSPDAQAATVTKHLREAREGRLAFDRAERSTGLALWIALAGIAIIIAVGVASPRALVASLAGAGAYYAVYNALFFLVRGNHWSLSAFNSEDMIELWMNTRLADAAVSGLVGVAVAALVYPFLRAQPKAPRNRYLPGWLTLGPLVVLVIQVTLAFQVAWFIWAWGVEPVWGMPDLKWGFKFNLDLIQMTALGAAALLAPALSYVIGRYHPRIRVSRASE